MEKKKKISIKDFHKKLKIKMVKKANKVKFSGRLGVIGLGVV
ncbi:MAG: hypothetical protein P8M17_09815 [Saprospiraceae bacterium]|jgi:hypothetical protein|nr:hypothetical protein [Saprospiraceae bacterium]MDG1432832.1 hypothetical protein [Saprospiraceae bacterium]MDG2419277.1 hypothetical protein [Saprospiraceae bacterium]